MRKIPKRNYIILFFLVLATVLLTLLIAKIASDLDKPKKSYISQNITNIKTNELDNYLIENSFVVIYLSDKFNLENEEYEKELVDKLNDYDIKKYFAFLSLDNNSKKYIEKKFNIEIKDSGILIIEDNVLVKNIAVNDNLVATVLTELYPLGVIND